MSPQEKVQANWQQLKGSVSHAVENLSHRAVNTAKDCQKIAQERPLTTLGIAALAGILVGLLIAKSLD